MKETKYTVTNRDLAAGNHLFKRACELAKVPATKRQASKWRNRRGQAYAQRHEAAKKQPGETL